MIDEEKRGWRAYFGLAWTGLVLAWGLYWGSGGTLAAHVPVSLLVVFVIVGMTWLLRVTYEAGRRNRE